MASERPDVPGFRVLYSPPDLGYLFLPILAAGGYGRPMVIRNLGQLESLIDGNPRPRAGGVEA